MTNDILTLALGSDVARTSTRQVGTRNDQCQDGIDVVKTPPCHTISHRVPSDGGTAGAAPMTGATTPHRRIDPIHAGQREHLVDALARRAPVDHFGDEGLPGGSIPEIVA